MKTADQSSPGTFSVPSTEAESKWHGHMADDGVATYGPEPMASLAATADTLILNGTRGNFRIPRLSVTKLSRGGLYPWFFSAVRIHHSIPGYPKNLQFKPLGLTPRDVIDRLKGLGYPVK